MKKILISTLLCFAVMSALCTAAFAQELMVGGQVVGIKMKTEGLLVAGLSSVQTDGGECSPAADAGLKQGDFIIAVNSEETESAADFIETVNACGGEPIQLKVLRNGKTYDFTVSPVRSAEEQWMLGMLLRDSLSGIGTLTFCDPDTGTYGALGHGVNDSESGIILPLDEGNISEAQIVGVSPGAQGAPGALNGCADSADILGSIEKNTERGIFGKAYSKLGTRMIETGDISVGPATILSTVIGSEVREYNIKVDRVCDSGSERRVVITVTDPALCNVTGGIVQGMSGSPIIQNGKLVGAVTHVFVNDPTRGYGISIYDMLSSAGVSEQAA